MEEKERDDRKNIKSVGARDLVLVWKDYKNLIHSNSVICVQSSQVLIFSVIVYSFSLIFSLFLFSAILWQLMRHHILSILSSLGSKQATEDSILQWANSCLEKCYHEVMTEKTGEITERRKKGTRGDSVATSCLEHSYRREKQIASNQQKKSKLSCFNSIFSIPIHFPFFPSSFFRSRSLPLTILIL